MINSTRKLLTWNGMERTDPRIITVVSPQHGRTEEPHDKSLLGLQALELSIETAASLPPEVRTEYLSLVKNTRSCFFVRRWPIYVTAARV